jgi:hypothetical protein
MTNYTTLQTPKAAHRMDLKMAEWGLEQGSDLLEVV